MAELTMVKALNLALTEMMREDANVLMMGEDVGQDEGVFRVTEGLLKEFGPDRVFDTPLAEAGIVGGAGAGMMASVRCLGVLLLLGVACAANARAAPYWVTWEGNDYPENEGWERRINGEGPAIRTIADGVLNIDGRWSTQVDDFYRVNRPLDPEPGEEFVMQWRLRVNEVIGNPLALYDPGVGLFSDLDNELTFVLGTDYIRSYHENAVIITIEPGVFHEYEVRSSDMQSYELRIDGLSAHFGVFWEPNFRRSGIDWGDYARGAGSSSDWDYFRFGVVPEPSSLLLVLASLCGARILLSTRRVSCLAFQLSPLLSSPAR